MAGLTGRPTKADQPARNRLLTAQAVRAERVNLVENGALVPAAAVREEWLNITLTIRTRLLAIPSRIAARHPGHAKLIADLEEEVTRALNELADDES